jgi:hypothetical protein
MKEIEDKYEGDERNRLFYVSAFSVPSTSSRSSPI